MSSKKQAGCKSEGSSFDDSDSDEYKEEDDEDDNVRPPQSRNSKKFAATLDSKSLANMKCDNFE